MVRLHDIGRLVAWAASATGLGLAAALAVLPDAAAALAQGWLARNGLGPASFAARWEWGSGLVFAGVRLRGRAIAIDRLVVGWTPDGLSLAGDRVESPLGAWRDVKATVALSDRHVRLSAALLTLPGEPASGKAGLGALRPFALTADLAPEGEEQVFTLRLDGVRGQRLATASGRATPDFASARAKVKVAKLTFAADGGPQPADLHHALAMLTQASGGLSAAGALSWENNRLGGNLDVMIEDFSATAGSATLRRLNGVVGFNSLMPLATPPGQMLAAAGIDAGVPLGGAVARFHLDGGGNAVIEEAHVALAGGRVALGAATLPLDGRAASLSLSVHDVDLADLAKLANLDGLAAAGRVDGVLPVRVGHNGIAVEGATLQAAAPGTLAYRPETPPAGLEAGPQGAGLLLHALENFHYNRLELSLTGPLGGDMALGIRLGGGNPELYAGHPVEFNLTVSGRLQQVLRQGLDSIHLPDEIGARMARFAAGQQGD